MQNGRQIIRKPDNLSGFRMLKTRWLPKQGGRQFENRTVRFSDVDCISHLFHVMKKKPNNFEELCGSQR
jgi:hypothetical protein